MNERVLIVDNEPGMRSILRLILARKNYQVVECTSGQRALEILLDPGLEYKAKHTEQSLQEDTG